MPKQYNNITWDPALHRNPSDVSVTNNIDYSIPACTRGIDMLLAKFRNEPYQTELQFASPQDVHIPHLSKPLAKARIAFVTDGGLVPKGNPDNLPPVNSNKFCIYPFYGAEKLLSSDYEISHQGYDNKYTLEDPNRLIPLDAGIYAVKEGRIANIFDFFYSTAGVMTSVENSQKIGHKIAESIKENGIDGVILTSTCGTSTRCGAYIAREIELTGIPVVHVTNLVHISEWVGCSRILCGNAICHVFGNPKLSPDQEFEYRKQLFNRALDILTEDPQKNSCIIAH